jgi:hypothetical protein
MKNIIFIHLLLIAVFTYAQNPKELGWDDLIPKDLTSFEDPFEKLTAEQLQNLSIVARIETLEEHKPGAVTNATRSERDSLRIVLKEENVNVDSLFKIRFEIAEKRRQRAEAIVDDLNGIQAKIPGYLLPLDYSGNAVTEFLLVPWVGACIHTPPPPKNQIIYVKLNGTEGYEVRSRFEAVWIEGEITTGVKSTELYLVDGSDDISSGYSMNANSIIPFNQ